MTTQGAVVGATAGFIAGLSDVASTVLWLAPGVDQLRLTVAFCAMGAAMGAVVGALVGAWEGLAWGPPWRRDAVLLAAPMGAVGHWLFAGGRMRHMPAQWLLQPLAGAALLALTVLALAVVRAVVHGAREGSARRRWVTAAGAFVAGWALHGVDHRVLPRLYEYLHVGLGAATWVAFAVAIASHRAWVDRASRRGAVWSALAVLAGCVAFARLDAWPNVRAEAFGVHPPFVRHGVIALSRLRQAPTRRAVHAVISRTHTTDATLPSTPGAHVLLLTVDAMRADRLSPSRSPHLAALAAQGVTFTHAYAQAPHSSYSLTSLHTGEYLHETVPLGQRQPLETLAGALAAQGYGTAALYTRGIFFTEGERLTAYRDEDFRFARADHVDRDADGQCEAAMRELDDVARRGEAPTVLWVHFFDAHAPYQGRGDTPVAQYDDAVRRIDVAVDRLVAHARRTLTRPIVIALTADHGEEFGEHGGVYHGSSLYEEQVHVPLVVVAPNVAPRRVDAPAQLVDVAPTLLALAGVAAPDTMRGDDLRPWMVGRAMPPRPVFSAVNTRRMAVRWPDKLIVDAAFGVEELYDLDADPDERTNLAGRDPALRGAMRTSLDAWLDALATSGTSQRALALGRMGQREAVPALVALARDAAQPVDDRVEAVALLSRFAAPELREALRPLLRERAEAITAAAAIALGLAGDDAGRARLRDLVWSDPPSRRHEAARALAVLGDDRGLDALTEAVWSDDEETSLDAVQALGALGSPRALDALMSRYADDHLRYRVVIALGRLRDPRVLPTLRDAMLRDPTDDVRANAVVGLGLLGDLRAAPDVASRITLDHAERYAAEALGAMGAVGRVPGVEGFDARDGGDAFARCEAHTDTLGWRLLGARSCVASGSVTVFVRASAGDRLLVVRARRDEGDAATLTVRAGDVTLATIPLRAWWEETRRAVRVPTGVTSLTLSADAAPWRVDHALLLAPAR